MVNANTRRFLYAAHMPDAQDGSAVETVGTESRLPTRTAELEVKIAFRYCSYIR